ncbi:MAG: dynamin family protein, partial [Verrucomicrobiota bacterium]
MVSQAQPNKARPRGEQAFLKTREADHIFEIPQTHKARIREHMDITNRQERADLLNWAKKIEDTLRQRGDDAGAQTVAQALKQYEEAPFLLPVMGTANRGKSTLINALLGRRDDTYAPVSQIQTSSVITRFSWAEKDQVTVHFREAKGSLAITPQQIKAYVTEKENPENQKQVEVVEVSGPFAGLDRELI